MPTDSRSLALIAAALFGTLALAAYWPTLHGPFLLDDYTVLPALAAAREAGLSIWETTLGAPSHVRGRALANLSFVLTQPMAAGAEDAFPFKLIDLILHLVTAVLFARLAQRLAQAAGEIPGRADWIAVIVGGLFLLHPLLLSTVAYPVQRMTQLSTLFLVLACLAYMAWYRGLAGPRPAGAHQWIRLAAVPALTLLAFASKETGVLAPLLIGSVQLLVLRWPATRDAGRKAFEQGFALCVAMPIAAGVVLFALRWPALLAYYSQRDFSLGERVLTQIHVLWEYIGLLLWPRVSAMGLYRDDTRIVSAIDPATALLGLAHVAALAAALALRRRAPLVSLGIAWFYVAHALESTIVPLELYFEHRNYLAAFGPMLVFAWMLTRLQSWRPVALAGMVILVLGWQTRQRAEDWSRFDTFIEAELAHHPGSLRATTERVLDLLSRSDGGAEAAQVVRTAAALHPDHVQPALLGLFVECNHDAVLDPSESWWQQAIVNKDSYHLFDALSERQRTRVCPGVPAVRLAGIANQVALNSRVRDRPRALAAWRREEARLHLREGNCTAAEPALEAAIKALDDDPRDWLQLLQCAVERGDRSRYLEWRSATLRRFGAGLPGLREALAELDARWQTETPVPSAPSAAKPSRDGATRSPTEHG